MRGRSRTDCSKMSVLASSRAAVTASPAKIRSPSACSSRTTRRAGMFNSDANCQPRRLSANTPTRAALRVQSTTTKRPPLISPASQFGLKLQRLVHTRHMRDQFDHQVRRDDQLKLGIKQILLGDVPAVLLLPFGQTCVEPEDS